MDRCFKINEVIMPKILDFHSSQYSLSISKLGLKTITLMLKKIDDWIDQKYTSKKEYAEKYRVATNNAEIEKFVDAIFYRNFDITPKDKELTIEFLCNRDLYNERYSDNIIYKVHSHIFKIINLDISDEDGRYIRNCEVYLSKDGMPFELNFLIKIDSGSTKTSEDYRNVEDSEVEEVEEVAIQYIGVDGEILQDYKPSEILPDTEDESSMYVDPYFNNIGINVYHKSISPSPGIVIRHIDKKSLQLTIGELFIILEKKGEENYDSDSSDDEEDVGKDKMFPNIFDIRQLLLYNYKLYKGNEKILTSMIPVYQKIRQYKKESVTTFIQYQILPSLTYLFDIMELEFQTETMRLSGELGVVTGVAAYRKLLKIRKIEKEIYKFPTRLSFKLIQNVDD
ncbi:hypothetical protein [Carp edema virus]|nr:hypothetical protein [Carp edema virus]